MISLTRDICILFDYMGARVKEQSTRLKGTKMVRARVRIDSIDRGSHMRSKANDRTDSLTRGD